MDLIDMQKYAHYNSGINWILVIVDVFSKKAWAFPLKDKSATTVSKQVSSFLDSEKYVLKIQSDNGPEFKNARWSVGYITFFAPPISLTITTNNKKKKKTRQHS